MSRAISGAEMSQIQLIIDALNDLDEELIANARDGALTLHSPIPVRDSEGLLVGHVIEELGLGSWGFKGA